MNYELAKELKDAGFPQTGRGGHVGPLDKLVWRREDRVYCPTLEELIEACGNSVGVFKKSDTEANAWSHKLYNPDSRHFTGTTPEEALARLWLALNKN